MAVQVEEKTSPPPSDLAMFSEKEFVAVESARDSKNPYQSPQFVAVKPKRGGLLWLLFSFQGRIPRRYFWGAQALEIVYFYAWLTVWANAPPQAEPLLRVLTVGGYLLLFWCNLAMTVKRLHDRNKSGFAALIGFIPVIGGLFLFVEAGCLRGTRGWNRFGPDPT